MKIHILCFKSDLVSRAKHPDESIRFFVYCYNLNKSNDKDLNISICTNEILNFIGCAIYEGKISYKDVKVEYQLEGDEIKFKEAFFTHDGRLESFPFGYFGWSNEHIKNLIDNKSLDSRS